jgi:hypothetical protein
MKMINSKLLIAITLVLCFTFTAVAHADLTDGLVGYWPLDEGMGFTATDNTGIGHDGTLTPTGINWTAGILRSAVDCHGSDSSDGFIDIPQHPALKPANISVQAWVNLDSIRTWDGIVGNFEDTGDTESGWALFTYGDTVGFYVSVAGAMVWTQVDLTLGQWTHLVGTYDGSSVKLYKNAETPVIALATGAIDYSEYAPLGMRIGQYYDSNEEQALDGRVDEVALWNRALTSVEVAELYNGGNGQNITDPMTLPTPAYGATDVPINVVLSWTEPNFTPEGYDVYFGTDANEISPNYDFEKVVDYQLVNSHDPYGETNLDFETTYYWQVDIYEPNIPQTVLHIGRVWKFTTSLPVPSFDMAYPEDLVVPLGQDAPFTIIATNPYTGDDKGLEYQWYKEPDIQLSNGADYTGVDTVTLTVVAADLDDEGGYFCRVTIKKSGEWADSPSAALAIAKIIGHWPFSGDTLDYSGLGNDGTPYGDPEYVVGVVDSNAIELDGDDYVTIDGVTDDILINDITMSVWVKTTDPEADFFSCNTATGGNVAMLEIWDGGYVNLYEGASEGWSTTMVSDNTWHLLTYSRIGSTGYIYIDGVLENTHEANFSFNPDDRWSIGQEWDGDTPSDFLIGQVDDARLYNYGLDKYQVAQLYVDVKDEGVCTDPIAADFTGDCLVTIEDFALLASEWLFCGRTPALMCP